MRLEPHALEKPACPFYSPSAMFGFTDPEDDRCALIPTNSGSDKCILKTESYSPYLTRIVKDKSGRNGCSLNTEKNRISLARRLREIERRELEREIKRQMEKYNIKVEYCRPGIALGSYDTPFDKSIF